MGFNIQELKKASANIQKEFSLSSADASRVVGFYNGGHEVNPDKVQKLLDGDFSDVSGIMERLGITGSGSSLNGTKEEKKTKKETPKAKKKERETEKGARQVSQIPAIDGEVIEDKDHLPEGFGDMVRGWFEAWANFEGVELNKLHAQQWRALCMYCGQKIKLNGYIDDKEAMRVRGGRIYSGKKLEELLQVWDYFCGLYKQVPLVGDFISFSGVSKSYFYDYSGRGLSSTSISILKKTKDVEENGLRSSVVSGGGSSVVGGLFLLKASHHYIEGGTQTEASPTTALTLGDLPKNLEDYSGNS